VERYPTLTYSGQLSPDATTVTGTLSGHGTQTPVELRVGKLRVYRDRIDVTATTRVDRPELGVTAGRGIIGRDLNIELTATFLRS
jgi:polyisoprenoid-binding protein YceI